MKNKLYDVTYAITDRGITYPQKTEEIVVKPGESVEQATKRLLNKYRHAMDMSKQFTFEIVSSNHVGYCTAKNQ